MRVSDFRAHHNAQLPVWYHWSAHVGVNLALVVLALAWPIQQVWSTWELIALPLFIFVWALIEYALHRFVLHGHHRLVRGLQREHTICHHGYFTDHAMSAEEALDLNRVLLLPHHLLLLLLLNALISLALGKAFFTAGVIYILLYELVHAYAHSSFGTVVNHRIHHDPSNMQRHFAIVFPVIDRWFGTDGGR